MEKMFSEWKNKICRDEGNAEGPLEMCGYKCIVTIVSMTVFLVAMFSYSRGEEQ